MKYTKTLCFYFLVLQLGFSQGPSKRYDFAKAYFGVDLIYTPNFGSSSFLNNEGQIEDFTRNGFITPAINIGGTHFWGYMDFYVSISTFNLKIKKDVLNTFTSYGALTGMKLYPLRLNDGKIRPFIGYKFSPYYYSQDNILSEQAVVTKVKSTIDLGLTYRLPKAYIYVGYNRIINPQIVLPISRTQFSQSSFPDQFVNFGVNWMIETTRSRQDDQFKRLNEYFGNTNKFGWFFAIGPSASFPIVSSTYIENSRPYLDNFSMPGIFADIALGYHFSKLETTTALSYRSINQYREAFGFQQLIKRKSLLAETYKFLVDYHGFNPFIGGGVSVESIGIQESDQRILVTDSEKLLVTPVITFGWDIRPAIKHDAWLLRTNLRYSPFLNLKIEGEKLSLQHLEFNFIQVVIYPQRIYHMRKGIN